MSPVADVKIMDVVVSHQDIDEGTSGNKPEEPHKIPMVAKTWNVLRLLCNKVKCNGGDSELMKCLRGLEG